MPKVSHVHKKPVRKEICDPDGVEQTHRKSLAINV